MSWPRAMRPQPICPIAKRLLGAFLPNTLEGTMSGNANAVVVAATALPKSRRVMAARFVGCFMLERSLATSALGKRPYQFGRPRALLKSRRDESSAGLIQTELDRASGRYCFDYRFI